MPKSTVAPVGSRFSRDIFWNLLGQAAPLLAALVSIPLLVQQLGADRFGLITIGWMLVGYFSIFDFGLGRALTQLLSQRLARQQQHTMPALIWTGMTLMMMLGLSAALVLFGSAPLIIRHGLNIPLHLQAEAIDSLRMLAPAIPLTIFATGIRGVLEAGKEFRVISLLRIPTGILLFAAPVLVLPFSHSLTVMSAIMVLTRLLTALAFLGLAVARVAAIRQLRFAAQDIPILLRFGGWMTISTLIGPVMVYMDRLFIGALLSIAAVTYYTAPYELITKLLIIPAAIAGVAFPDFARLHGQQDWAGIRALYRQSLRYTALLVLPVGLALAGAPTILRLWLDDAFAVHSSQVLQILALGILVNGLAHIPYALIQGLGKPRITATLHALEFVLYIPVLIVLIKHIGINGAALAWLLRVSLDAALLFYCASKELQAR